MFDIGIEQDDPDAFEVEREIDIVQALTVEADDVVPAAEHAGELIHDAALDAHKDVFRPLGQPHHRELVQAAA